MSKHLTLIDPEKQEPEKAGRIAEISERAGSCAILVGGSTHPGQEVLDRTIIEIKKRCGLKTILFPSSSAMLSSHADGIFFMSLLNSRDRRYLIEEQAKGAKFIKRSKLEVIPLGYIVVGNGEKVGDVGRVEFIDERDVDKLTGYALAAQFFGVSAIYIEKGSGAEKPIEAKTVREVKRELDIPLIVGGGIKTPEQAKELSNAGCDYIVTGTIVEQTPIEKLYGVLREIIGAIR
ncbi:MAG: geranylgeranylglyceryl/heptaprenylglyceryl phosphate synthase [Candidatus Thermoplasmatota archaeon]|nr:geranylgeranylglyceryl/heptaprenylglyceryl phosphate synthase [Candidatus Thermoplasmatota archaeon]